MFLIDSAVWIEYLRPKGAAKVKEKVRELLSMRIQGEFRGHQNSGIIQGRVENWLSIV